MKTSTKFETLVKQTLTAKYFEKQAKENFVMLDKQVKQTIIDKNIIIPKGGFRYENGSLSLRQGMEKVSDIKIKALINLVKKDKLKLESLLEKATFKKNDLEKLLGEKAFNNVVSTEKTHDTLAYRVN